MYQIVFCLEHRDGERSHRVDEETVPSDGGAEGKVERRPGGDEVSVATFVKKRKQTANGELFSR